MYIWIRDVTLRCFTCSSVEHIEKIFDTKSDENLLMLIKSLCCRECEGGQDGRRGEQPGSVQTSLCAIQQSGRDQHLHLRHRQLPLHTDTHGLHRSVGPIYNFNLRPQIVHIHIFYPRSTPQNRMLYKTFSRKINRIRFSRFIQA